MEPIQGEAGVNIPSEGYLRGVRALCDKYNVLWIADEVQSGLGRTGKLVSVDHEGVKPDILVLGKALSGGFYPVSCALANNSVMECIKPGEHGSTFGGNPLAAAVGRRAMEVLVEEKMVENSEMQGARILNEFRRLYSGKDFVRDIRGRGLFIAFEVDPEWRYTAQDLCLRLMERGVLAKPTHFNKIRFSPPLVIGDAQVDHLLQKMDEVIRSF